MYGYRAIHKDTGELRMFPLREQAESVLHAELGDWTIERTYNPAWRLPIPMLPDANGYPADHPLHRPRRADDRERRTHG
ncbi:hypothetical protein CFN78_06825 [Amycolatopsis antarctica]|uniref:Uncharacterized protein n=1 Tax=Amycolatopsis antarctica TaxID=1854586 RepID=A0A263D943_9PSEU|nr:hypothetical protein [Amycolatopsis antarctica]OZM73996.1 hypothetical protein CFN78_06825 [Amycolatopsis antarctica]